MQRSVFFLLAISGLALASCGRPTAADTLAPAAALSTQTPAAPASQLVNPTAEPTLPPAATPTAMLVPSPTGGPAHTIATDLALDDADVVLYPVPTVYAGDKVTFQLLPHVPETINVNDVNAAIFVDGQQVAGGPLDRRNWNGQAEGVYEWAWDTTGLAGEHTIEIVLDPSDAIQTGDEDATNNRVTMTTTVEVASGQAALDVAATWQTTEINCCIVHVVSDTAAARELATLLPQLEAAVNQAADRLTVQPSHKIDVYLIDRIVGQGGFAGADMVVSYADRQYAGGGIYELLVHEAAHILDQQFAPRRISFLAEGLAVWVSGGHYKPEDLTQRSAALVAMGRNIPLAQLIDDFYPVQHEVGYLEAAGFVTFLIDRAGWSTFKEFYSDVSADDGPTLSAAVDANLQRYYGITLAQAESDWLAGLKSNPPPPAAIEDLRTTIRYYDVARRYQALYDPTAHYLSAWLPHPTEVRQFGNPADLTRRPKTEMNVTLEVMLVAADTAMRDGDYVRANVILDSVSGILDHNGTIIDPMATSYLGIVRAAAEYGYELHAVELAGGSARAMATQSPDPRLKSLVMEMRGQNWVILSH